MEMLFYLEDFLFLNGIDISVGSSSMYGIYGPISIEIDGEPFLLTKNIIEIGKKVVDYITNKISNGNDVLIEKNELHQFLPDFVIV